MPTTMSMSSELSMSQSMSMPVSSSSASMDMSMSMSSATASSMSMPMATASPTSSSTMSGMDMGGSDSGSGSGSMSMTMFMTTKYANVPVFFKTLHAQNGAGAFGIFCVLFFCSFFFRGLVFLSSYLEQAVFHNYSNTIIIEEDCECGPESDSKDTPPPTPISGNGRKLTFGQVMKQLFYLTPGEFMRDVIRLLLAFTIVMFGYAIMLAAMSFVLTYFFAICLGLAFADVFFNRLAIILDINKNVGACSSFH